jgi:hypothetical protein
MSLQGIYAEPLSIRDALINKDLREKLDLAERKLNSLEESWRRSSGGDDTLKSPR